MYHIGMKQMQARLQKELIHTLYAILFVRVNSNFIDFLGKFYFPKFPNNFITIFFLNGQLRWMENLSDGCLLL